MINRLCSYFGRSNLIVTTRYFSGYLKGDSDRITHENIAKLSRALGYKGDLEGLCVGISHKAIEAIVTKRMGDFDRRIEKIDMVFDRLERERGSLQGLERFDKKYLQQTMEAIEPGLHIDMTAFFDAVHLIQNPHLYPKLFHDRRGGSIFGHFNVAQALAVFPLTASKTLEAEGGLVEVEKFADVLTEEKFAEAFELLTTISEKNGLQDPIGCEIVIGNHAVALGRNPSEKRWSFIDANEILLRKLEVSSDLSKELFRSFYSLPGGRQRARVIMYSTKRSSFAVQKILHLWKKKYALCKVNEETKLFADDLLFASAEIGDLAGVCRWIEAGVNPDAIGCNYAPALCIAAQHGYIKIVKALADSKANVNAVAVDGGTPLIMAALRGHKNVVKFLLEAGADINKASREGITALYVACQNGHIEIVKYLLL